jgi:hypothetical protein
MHRAEFLEILIRAIESRDAETLKNEQALPDAQGTVDSLLTMRVLFMNYQFGSIADYKGIGSRAQNVNNIQRWNNNGSRPSNWRRWHPLSCALALCGMYFSYLKT